MKILCEEVVQENLTIEVCVYTGFGATCMDFRLMIYTWWGWNTGKQIVWYWKAG